MDSVLFLGGGQPLDGRSEFVLQAGHLPRHPRSNLSDLEPGITIGTSAVAVSASLRALSAAAPFSLFALSSSCFKVEYFVSTAAAAASTAATLGEERHQRRTRLEQ